MRKVIYQQIKQTLLSIVDQNQNPVIQHVDLWNQQTLYAQEEQPFYTPAVFIEFPDINWQHLPHGVREADIQVSLHVVTDSRVGHWEDAADRFELLDTINAALHGLSWQDDDGNAMNPLTSSISSTDSDFDELQDNIEVYTTHVVDTSANKREVYTTATLDITASIDVHTEPIEEAPPESEDSPILGN